MTLVPISRETHASMRVSPLRSFDFAAQMTAVPVFGGELIQFSHEIPVILIADGDGFTPAALCGVSAGENLLIDDQGRWMGSNIPNIWKRGPFRLARVEGGEEEKLVLCLDDESPLVNHAEGQPLFDETGAPSPLLNAASALLGQMEHEMRATRKICAALHQLGMIVPWSLEIPQGDGTSRRVSDLYQVDEAKIAKLSAEDLAALRDLGALPLIYAHLLSLSKISLLLRLAKMAADRRQQREALKKGNLNLDQTFGIVEDDPFIF